MRISAADVVTCCDRRHAGYFVGYSNIAEKMLREPYRDRSSLLNWTGRFNLLREHNEGYARLSDP